MGINSCSPRDSEFVMAMEEGGRSVPSLADFLAAQVELVRSVSPRTVLHTQGGTRRRAVLSGLAPHSSEYMRVGFEDLIMSCCLWFKLGTKHVFTGMVCPPQIEETSESYRAVLSSIVRFLLNPRTLNRWKELGIRVRIFGHQTLPEFEDMAKEMNSDTIADDQRPTLWLYVNGKKGGFWNLLVDAILAKGTGDEQVLREYLYGEDFPPAEVHYSYGKPMIDRDFVPPLAVAPKVQCYWGQKPGYPIDESTYRRIIYDFAYLRPTWKADKESRYSSVVQYRDTWESPLVIGIGRRLGSFWYPEQIEANDGDTTNDERKTDTNNVDC
jgi:hypothetical protein